jgi:hypothetical protein
MEITDHHVPVLAPVPPTLEHALGYEGERRFVAFYWEQSGDELCWSDGRSSLCGAEWPAWLAYTRHPAVRPHLQGWDFGSSDGPAQHWLLLDREERSLWAGRWDHTAMFLAALARAEDEAEREPWAGDAEASGPSFIDHLELARFLEGAWEEVAASVTMEQVEERMRESDRRTAELARWLDDWQEVQP